MHNPTRRRVLAAGFAGTLLGLAGGRSAAAGTTPPTDETVATPPRQPTPSDVVLLQFALSLEMTARDLYQTAMDAGNDDPLVSIIRANHAGYIDILRAILGTRAVDRRNEELYGELAGGFEEPDMAAFAVAAYDFESTAVATHTEALRSLQNLDAARRVSSILIVEARHCTVLADAAGLGDDFDALFVNDADPLSAGQSSGG